MAKRKSTKSPAALDTSLRILVLHGKESFLITESIEKLKSAAQENYGEVEVLHFNGKTAEAADVLDEARSFGLMQQYKIIIVDQADDFFKESTGHRPIVIRYCEHPAENATIVFRSERWNASGLDKAIRKVGTIIKCEEVKSDRALDFVITRAEKVHHITIHPKAANLLVQRVGTSLGRLNAELARLAVMADPEDGITVDIIETQVRLSRQEQAWALQTVLLQAKPADAMRKLSDLMGVSKQAPALMFYCYSDLARKLFTASRMREDRRNAGEIDAYFGNWNPIRHPVKNTAGRFPSPQFASLMAESINAPLRQRTGFGDERRSVDLLAVRFLACLHHLNR